MRMSWKLMVAATTRGYAMIRQTKMAAGARKPYAVSLRESFRPGFQRPSSGGFLSVYNRLDLEMFPRRVARRARVGTRRAGRLQELLDRAFEGV